MFQFCEKGASLGVTLIRVVLGIIFVAHGAHKVSMMQATLDGFAAMGLSTAMTFIVTYTELLGGLALVAGAFTRLAAFGQSVIMLGAIFTVHGQHGFFLNWFMVPNQGHGFEYNLALLTMAVLLVLAGPGRWSVDQILAGLQQTKLKRHSYDERVE